MPEAPTIDYRKLYDAFVPALERELGRKDEAVIHAIIGFEFGGPPDLLLFRNAPGVRGIFYVTSDLLFFERQPRNSLGRYEVAICTPTESNWAEHVLYRLAQATVEDVFDVGHTADITAWVDPECVIKGLVFTKLAAFEFSGRAFGALLCVGVTRAELDYAREHGSESLLTRLKAAGAFPVTDPNRKLLV
jgi:hypothetical protein